MVRDSDFRHSHTHHAAPTGDDIAAHINEMQPKETNLSNVAHLLTEAHAHRPGQYHEDLTKVNTALHEKGILTDMNVVGVRGEDLIARDNNGHVRVYDSHNTKYSYEDNGGNYNDKFGRNKGTFGFNPDGSGIYQVAGRDNAWTIADDMLKQQGIEHPTKNQRGNFVREMAAANPGTDLSKLAPGEELTIPASTYKPDKISPERSSIAASQAYAELNTNFDGASVALRNHSETWGMQNYMHKDQIDAALKDPSTPANERPGLEFMSKNFDALKVSNGWYKNCITDESLAQWKADQARHIENRKIQAFEDRVRHLLF